ncbi:hypothetical protein [Aquitalea aquatica]|uniref:Uncharacterized protein n=1 Tax=Aquitalea aquatica TaxID=3044273 RepID=A0A838Y2W3_9NEIS|nr:hypothetical protein [Aquitalea magnusonii]MBA4709006.1 hypothetical protein [Aquitalea magnusonii]
MSTLPQRLLLSLLLLLLLPLSAWADTASGSLADDPSMAPYVQNFSQLISKGCMTSFANDSTKLKQLEQQLGHAITQQNRSSYCSCAADKAMQALTMDDLSEAVANSMSGSGSNTFKAFSPEIKKKIVKASFQCLDRLTN